jgi:hypothetical protein
VRAVPLALLQENHASEQRCNCALQIHQPNALGAAAVSRQLTHKCATNKAFERIHQPSTQSTTSCMMCCSKEGVAAASAASAASVQGSSLNMDSIMLLAAGALPGDLQLL